MRNTTSRKVSTKYTPEERQAQAAALHDSITNGVEALRDSGAWQRYLDFMKGFHRYSFNNLMLIMMQYPEATMVTGYRKWQEKGRQVRKGEKAIRIFGFSQKKVTEQDTSGEEVEKTLTFFPVLSVFAIEQTDAIDPDAEDPRDAVRPTELEGDDALGVYDAVAAFLTREGWKVSKSDDILLTNAKGYTDPETRSVVVRADMAAAQQAKTALHEAAHVLLGHGDDEYDYRGHRGVAETEAESVAYVVAGMLGLDTSAYSIGYVAGWSQADPKTVRETAARVLKAAHTLFESITSNEEN